jgi:hypothetical protein
MSFSFAHALEAKVMALAFRTKSLLGKSVASFVHPARFVKDLYHIFGDLRHRQSVAGSGPWQMPKEGLDGSEPKKGAAIPDGIRDGPDALTYLL